MKKFWQWTDRRIRDQSGEEKGESTLYLNGIIAEESWYDDEVTPAEFKAELEQHSGDITVWINSPGGDCIAASQIYTMLMEHKGNVTVKIDGLAASAASVIAMAGTSVLMAPTSLMMIHNPSTIAWGDHAEMQKTIDMLDEVKESIINAYQLKTGSERSKLSALMDAETWMSANKAVELGFADGVLQRIEDGEGQEAPPMSMIFSRAALTNSLSAKIQKKNKIEMPAEAGRPIAEIRERLETLKRFI